MNKISPTKKNALAFTAIQNMDTTTPNSITAFIEISGGTWWDLYSMTFREAITSAAKWITLITARSAHDGE